LVGVFGKNVTGKELADIELSEFLESDCFDFSVSGPLKFLSSRYLPPYSSIFFFKSLPTPSVL